MLQLVSSKFVPIYPQILKSQIQTIATVLCTSNVRIFPTSYQVCSIGGTCVNIFRKPPQFLQLQLEDLQVGQVWKTFAEDGFMHEAVHGECPLSV